MAKDPLSVAAVQLPGSSFDPVQFAKEEYAEGAIKRAEGEKERQAAYDVDLETPERWDDLKFEPLLDMRYKLDQFGTLLMMKGYDMKDLSKPENRRAAAAWNSAYKQYEGDVDFYNSARKAIQEADKLVKSELLQENPRIDIEKTNERKRKLIEAKSIDEMKKLINEYGSQGIIVPKEKQTDILGELASTFKDWIEPKEGSTIQEKDGRIYTQKIKQVTPDQVKSTIRNKLKFDKEFAKSVEQQRKKDDIVRGDDMSIDASVEYLYNQMGKDKAFTNVFRNVKAAPGGGGGATTFNKNGFSNVPVTTKTTIGKNNYVYDLTGVKGIELKESDMQISIPVNAIDASNGKPAGIPNKNVEFMPRHVTKYPIATKTIKKPYGEDEFGLGLFREVIAKEGDIIPDDQLGLAGNNYVYKRFVEGMANYKKGETEISDKIFIPYEEVASDLEPEYKGLRRQIILTDLDDIDESQLSGIDKKAYEAIKKNPDQEYAQEALYKLLKNINK